MTSTIKVNNIQNQCGANIINENSNTITLGASGDTIALASGASQSGFGRTGTVDWDTTPKTATFSAVSGDGFFCNTTAGSFTCNLPAGTAGAIVSLADYAGTWQTNKLIVSPNGTDKIGSVNADANLETEGQSVTFIFVDSTQGWINIQDSTSNVRAVDNIVATGGTIVTCGNFKTHIFTGPGTFAVSCISSCASLNVSEYLIVAGGGSGGTRIGGGGGAGGARVFETSPLKSPIVAPAGVTLSVQSYPITVGGGGTGQPYPSPAVACSQGSNSVALGLTSTGGGRGASYNTIASASGGSGGGGSGYDGKVAAGNGNTPSVTPSQGNPGGAAFGNSCGPGSAFNLGGGGGGAEVVGTTAAGPSQAGPGGLGVRLSDAFIGPTAPSYGTPGPASNTRFFAGGGGAGPNGAVPNGGGGGKGYAPDAPAPTGRLAIANTGGGGGSTPGTPGPDGISGAGGSGIVMIRYRYK